MAQIDEPIAVVEYDHRWPGMYADEACRLGSALGDIARGIEHYGSTAVPGLASKPVVDILIGVDSLELDALRWLAMERLGYEHLSDPGKQQRLCFRRHDLVTFNVSMVRWRGDRWFDGLVIREYLRTFPEEAHRYGQHKRDIVAQGATMLVAYSGLKAPHMASLVERARLWRDDQGPVQGEYTAY